MFLRGWDTKLLVIMVAVLFFTATVMPSYAWTLSGRHVREDTVNLDVPLGGHYRTSGEYGYILEFPYSSGSVKVFEVRAGAARPRCGILGFLSDLQGLISDPETLENRLFQVATAALSTLPLVMLAYASPTLADAYKHMKMFMRGIATWDTAQCDKLEDYALNAGAYMRAERDTKYHCLKKQMDRGMSLHQALQECSSSSSGKTFNFLTGSSETNINIGDVIVQALGVDTSTHWGKYVATLVGAHVDGQVKVQEHPMKTLVGKMENSTREELKKLWSYCGNRQQFNAYLRQLREQHKNDREFPIYDLVFKYYDYDTVCKAKLQPDGYIWLNAMAHNIAIVRAYAKLLELMEKLKTVQQEAQAKGAAQSAAKVNEAMNKLKGEIEVFDKTYNIRSRIAGIISELNQNVSEREIKAASHAVSIYLTRIPHGAARRESARKTLRYRLPPVE